MVTPEQLRLDVEAPRSWRLPPATVYAGSVWLPRCREILAQAIEAKRTGG